MGRTVKSKVINHPHAKRGFAGKDDTIINVNQAPAQQQGPTTMSKVKELALGAFIGAVVTVGVTWGFNKIMARREDKKDGETKANNPADAMSSARHNLLASIQRQNPGYYGSYPPLPPHPGMHPMYMPPGMHGMHGIPALPPPEPTVIVQPIAMPAPQEEAADDDYYEDDEDYY